MFDPPKPTDGPAPRSSYVDAYVGGRIRLRRSLLGMSQENLAEALGLTFQQIQKYERGLNRIGASRLYELSSILDVPMSFFFEGLDSFSPARHGMVSEGGGASFSYQADPMARRETLELVRAYYQIPDAQIRKKIVELIRALATSSGGK